MTTKRFLLMLLVTLMSVTGAWAQNNIVRYTATEDLSNLDWQSSFRSSIRHREYNPQTQFGFVEFYDDVKVIDQPLFDGRTSLISIDLPASITSINEHTFVGCSSLIAISLPAGLTFIGDHSFQGCYSLTSINIPANVSSFGRNSFESCSSLTKVTINSQQTLNAIDTSKDYRTFGPKVTDYVLKGDITEIPDSRFEETNVKNITLPETLVRIGQRAFYGKTINSITIPASVNNIGADAFANCILGNKKVLSATPPTVGSGAFRNVTKSYPLYVPKGSVDAYKAADGWKDFTNIIAMDCYSLNLVSSNSSLGKVFGGGTFDYGSEQTIYAVPEAGCKFTGWSDGNTENPRQYTGTCDVTLTANFEKVFDDPTGSGMRLKITKKNNKVYEFKTQDVKSVDYYRVNE